MKEGILGEKNRSSQEAIATKVDTTTEGSVPTRPRFSLPRDFGNYVLLSEIGRGGMGTVYRAEQKSLRRSVALKVFHQSDDDADPRALARFEREAQVMARLTHPDIVQVHDFGLQDGLFFIAMDLVDGLSLDRFCRSYFPALEYRVTIAERVARALHHAHLQGVVHRDVKPPNLLVDREGNVKLSDFGLAKLEGSKLTQAFGIMGTPHYMSPEQAAGRTDQIDARTDVYSLGVVLYELITGQLPFGGTSVDVIIHQVLHKEPILPRHLNPSIPRDLETVCLKAMAKEASRRYSTALELAEDLERYKRGTSILARRPPLATRCLGWARLHRAALVIAAVAIAVSAVGLHLYSRLRERDRLGQVHREAKLRFAEREYGVALPLVEQLRGTSLEDPELQLQRAICLCELERRAEAEQEFSTYLRQFPHDAAAWRHRGLNALEEDDLANAVLCYRESAKLSRVAFAEEAEKYGDLDALIALVERHYRADALHALPHVAAYDPSYDFIEPPDSPPYDLSSEWARRFPYDSARPPNARVWEREAPGHPVVLGWQAKGEPELLDRAIRLVPVSRWFRLFRLQAHLAAKRFSEVERDRAALEILLPGHSFHKRLVKLFWEAAGSAARGGNVEEAIRLLGNGKPSRAKVESAEEFRSLRSQERWKAFLETLPP